MVFVSDAWATVKLTFSIIRVASETGEVIGGLSTEQPGQGFGILHFLPSYEIVPSY